MAALSLSGSVSAFLPSSSSCGFPAPALLSTQQALQFAKAVDEELEDLKSLAKSLEEKNRSLLAQARQTVGAGPGKQRCLASSLLPGVRAAEPGREVGRGRGFPLSLQVLLAPDFLRPAYHHSHDNGDIWSHSPSPVLQ